MKQRGAATASKPETPRGPQPQNLTEGTDEELHSSPGFSPPDRTVTRSFFCGTLGK